LTFSPVNGVLVSKSSIAIHDEGHMVRHMSPRPQQQLAEMANGPPHAQSMERQLHRWYTPGWTRLLAVRLGRVGAGVVGGAAWKSL